MKANATITEPIPGPMPDTPEWYEARKDLITASDIPAILGKSEYKTALDVFLEKTGRVPAFGGNEHTRRGKRYEAVILGDYGDTTGRTVLAPLPLFVSPTCPVLAATPDGASEGEGCDVRGVEAKFTMSAKRAAELGEEGSDKVPDDWHLQTQTQARVIGWQFVDVAVLLFGRLKLYTVERNDVIGDVIESAAVEMAERIKNDDPPEPTWEHPQTARALAALYDVRPGVTVELPQVCGAWVKEYVKQGERIKRREQKRESLKCRILDAMGEAEIGLIPGIDFEVTRSTSERAGYTVKPTTVTTMRIRKARK